MKAFIRSLPATLALGLALLFPSVPPSARGATYTWDPTASGGTAVGGGGTWDLSGTTWYNGTTDQAWTDTTGASDLAVFGGAAGGTVTLGTNVGALGLVFNTAGYTLTSSTLTLGGSGIDTSALSSGTVSISSAVILGASQSWNVGAGSSLTASGVISGSNALTKTGGGILNLSAVNTFSGGLTISSGSVAISSNTALGGASGTAGAVTIDGGTLRVNLGNTAMTNTHPITIGGNGGTITVGLPSSGTPTWTVGNGLLSGSGTLTVSGVGTLGSAGSNGSVVVFASGNVNSGFTGNVAIQNGGIVEFASATGIPVSGTFNVNNLGMLSANSVTIAQAVNVNDGGYLAFQNAGTGVFSGPITLSGSTNVRMQNWWSTGVQNGAITGNIGGTGSLNLNSGSGSGGTLTLSGTNTYSGSTTVSASVLKATKAFSLPGYSTAGKISIGTTATLSLNAGGTGEFAGADLETILSNVSFASGATLSVDTTNATATVAETANISIAGLNLTKAGAGTLSLGGSNTYSGATTISAGALQLNNSNVVKNSTVTINAANGLVFNSGIGTFNFGGLAGSASQALTDTGSNAVTLVVGSNNATTTYSGALSGSGAIIKTGTGTLTFTGVSSYSGATTVNAGTLALGSANTVPNIANSDVTVNSGASFLFGSPTSVSNVTTTIANSLTLNSATARLVGGFRSPTDQFTNNLTLASGANLVAVDGNTNGGFGSQIRFAGLTRSGTSSATVLFRGGTLGANGNVNANNTGHPQNILFTTAPALVGGGGAISTSTTSIIPYAIGDNGYAQGTLYLTSGLGTDFVSYNPSGGTGAGVQLLTTYANTITSGASVLNNVKVVDSSVTGVDAATTINSLILSSTLAASGTLGSSSIDGAGTLTINSGALLVTTSSPAASNGGTGGNYGGLFINNATIGASGLTLGFGSAEGVITVTGSSTLTLASTSGGISGTGGLTKSGAGDLYLNAAGSLSGNVAINAGRIVLGNSNALQNATLNYNSQGGSLSFDGLTAATLGGLTGSQSLALSNTSSGNVALTVGNNGVSSSYAGSLTGGGSLAKSGTGTFTLTGTSSYTGSTSVNNGTLKLVGGSLAGTSSLAVNGGGTLVATGSIGNLVAGLATVAGSSSQAGQGVIDLSTDFSPTTVLRLNGGLTIGGANSGDVSQLYFDLAASGSASDLITLGSGALTGNAGGAVINIGSSALNNATYTLINYGSASGLSIGSNLTVGTHPSQLFTSFTLALSSTTGAGSLTLTVQGTPVPNLAYWTGNRGGSYNWGDNDGISATNWALNQAGTTDAGQLVGDNSDVVFAATNATAASLNTNLETSYSINSLTVLGSDQSALFAPVISGSGSLTLLAQASGTGSLGYSAGTGIVVNSGAAGLTISTTGGVKVPNSQSWTNNSGGNLLVASNVNGSSVNSAPVTLTLRNTGTGATVISGAIGDGAGSNSPLSLIVNNSGSGATLLSASNNYTGGTSLIAGALQAGNPNALGSGPVVLNSGTLDVNGVVLNVFTLTGSNGALVTNNSSVQDGTLVVNNSGSGTFAGTLSDGANGRILGLTLNGSGTLILTGTNTNTGAITVASGVLQVGNGGATGSLGTGDVANNGVLRFNRSDAITVSNNLSGSGTVQQFGAGSLVLPSNINGGLSILHSGAGALTLSGSNSYTGSTVVSSGTLILVGNAGNGGTVSGGTNSAISSSSALTLNNGASLSLASDVDTLFAPASLTMVTGGNNSFIVNSLNSPAGDNHTITLANNAGLGNGNTTLNVSSSTGDTLKFGSSFGASNNGSSAWGGPTTTFNLSGANVILNGMNANDGGIAVSSTTGNSLTINGTVSNGSNRTIFAVLNSGVLTLNNTVSNGGSINNGFFITLNSGTLNINNNGAINTNASSGNGGGAGLKIEGGALDNTSGSAVTESSNPTLRIDADFAFSSDAGTSANDLNLGTGAVTLGTTSGTTRTITTNGSATLTMGGSIANGTTANSLAKNGTGTLALTGVLSYTGNTTVNNGTLILSGSNTMSGATLVNAGTLTANNATGSATGSGSVTVESGATLNGSGRVSGPVVTSGVVSGGVSIGGDVTVNATGSLIGSGSISGNTVVSGGISGSVNFGGDVTINAAGSMSGSHTFGGNIILNNSVGSNVASDIAVAAAKTLSGTGGTDGNVSAAATSTIAPGNGGVGNLSMGSLSTVTGAHLSIDINGTTAGLYDTITVANTINLTGGDLTLNLSSFTPGTDNLFLVINSLGGAGTNFGTSGNFDSITFTGTGSGSILSGAGEEGTQLNLNGTVYTLTYQADFEGNALTNGNDIALIAGVPEPSTWVSLLGGLGMLAVCLRRRH